MSHTLSQQLQEDPQLIEGKKLILGALKKHQKSITGIRPSKSEFKADYESTIKRLEEIRAGGLIYPYLGSGFGKGPFVELEDGSVKYDFICGIGVYQFGHANPDIVEASIDGAIQDTLIQGHVQQNRNSLELSEQILGLANQGQRMFDHCFLTSSGVMAAENALKLTFNKNQPANRIFAFKRCFAGRTIAFSHINDKAMTRAGLPDAFPVDHVPFFDPEDPEGSTQRTLEAIKTKIEEFPSKHAGMIFELVQGEGGFYPGESNYFRKVMEFCKSKGIAVLVDEIQTFSRLKTPFAYQYFGLQDLVDMAWIGKASQVCATLFKSDWKPPAGLLGQTYTSATSTIEGAKQILKALSEEPFFGDSGKIERLSKYTQEKLAQFEAETGLINGPFGLGSMICFTPYNGDGAKVGSFLNRLFENGVIALSAGSNPTKCRFLLPYPVIEEDDIEVVLNIVFSTLKELA